MKRSLIPRAFLRFPNLLAGCALSVVVAAATVSNAQAETSLFKVSKNGQTLYLGGTIHVLSQTDFPLPAEYDQAFEASTDLVFETDMSSMQLPQTQQKMMMMAAQPVGMTLRQQLSPATFKALQQYCAQNQLPLMMFDNMKAGAASVVMMVIALQKLGLSSDGVDQYFFDKATQAGRRTIALESVDEQLSFISNMGEGVEDELIKQTLSDLDQLPIMMASLKQAWRTGDMSQLKRLGIEPMKQSVPKVYDLLLKQRNNRWMPKIEAMLATKPIEYVLVGALHLVGKDGLLTQLAAKGYQIDVVRLKKTPTTRKAIK